MTSKRHYILFTFLILIGISSCTRKWKKTSSTTFEIETINSSNKIPFVEITDGIMKFEKISFEGTRKQADDVVFEDEFSKEIALSSNPIYLSNYDIPQGTFSLIKTELIFDNSDNNNSIELVGNIYKSAKSSKIPFHLFIKKQVALEISTLKTTEIIAEIETTGTIKLNLIDWFSLVPHSFLDEAKIVMYNNKATIIISEDSNVAIYSLILEKIGKNDDIVFN